MKLLNSYVHMTYSGSNTVYCTKCGISDFLPHIKVTECDRQEGQHIFFRPFDLGLAFRFSAEHVTCVSYGYECGLGASGSHRSKGVPLDRISFPARRADRRGGGESVRFWI